jgi:hypothetical protein
VTGRQLSYRLRIKDIFSGSTRERNFKRLFLMIR